MGTRGRGDKENEGRKVEEETNGLRDEFTSYS